MHQSVVSCFRIEPISYPESSGSLVSGLVAGRDSGEMELFPLKSGDPVIVRMLSFIKTEVNVSGEVGMFDESLGRQSEVLNGYLQIYFLARGLMPL